jgi:hypothetical protein
MPAPWTKPRTFRENLFDFHPGEPRRFFEFRILRNVPYQHGREHYCFCRIHGCLYHYDNY